ncbi:pseudaminic acid synthase [Paenibacillus lentus]|uniref:pseudaminic acid synthase n=1 Tax=Paenibacillus lentus TaxID=1338368 RepID=UPI00364B26EC
MKDVRIGKYLIGEDHSPFIVAEMSGNHNQSLEQALKIVEAAAAAGAHALKLQTYTANTITLNARTSDFTINNSHSMWNGRNLYDLYSEAYTPWEWHAQIFNKCKELGLVYFSSPFDETAVDFLESLDVPCYKIASYENGHIPLIKKVAQTGKPIIMSTGMATVAELDEAVRVIKETGNEGLILLKCTSNYPASPKNSNVSTIPYLKKLFDCQVGLSDHTMGIGAPLAAVAFGATLIEKHFTISRAEGGVDAAFSMEPNEMQSLVIESKRAWEAIGKVQLGPTETEFKSRNNRRSIYASENISIGETITKENVKIVRPGFGLEPIYMDTILGRTAKTEIKKGTPISWDLI